LSCQIPDKHEAKETTNEVITTLKELMPKIKQDIFPKLEPKAPIESSNVPSMGPK
jgi:hypothetical protein